MDCIKNGEGKSGIKKQAGRRDLILVVDDDAGILRAFNTLFKNKKNISIYTSSNPEKIFEIIMSRKPRMVILDMKLPGFSGVEILRKIKWMYPELPVMVMTAYSNVFTRQNLVEMGADDYLSKPFEIKDMFSKVRQLIQKKMV